MKASDYNNYVEEALTYFDTCHDHDTIGETGYIRYLKKHVKKLYQQGAKFVKVSKEEGIILIYLPKNISAAVAVTIANMQADEISELESDDETQSVIKLWWD